ncbi:NnrU family protein [Altericroceibacterium endophyticum]|nr:NnrU family protein [Altericroceibacterium endophyticum]
MSFIPLLSACGTLLGTHFLLSHPLRKALVSLLGERIFLALYSLIAFGAIGWIAVSFRKLPPMDLGGSGIAGWIIASLLTILALVLLLGSFTGNPALPDPSGEPKMPSQTKGVFRITRHPMMWGFALWAIAHITLWWSMRTVIVGGTILILALLGSALQDMKKERLMGLKWKAWENQTSFWPRWQALPAAGWLIWTAALILWLGITWAHGRAGIPAGIWRWIG